jgi:hypothetical protein
MRKTLIPFVLLAACSPNASTPTTPDDQSGPTLTIDYTLPAPTNVSAAVVQLIDANRASVRLTWTDNSTFLDEFNTCAAAVTSDGTSAGGGCVYAVDYDQPRGSTGVRSGTIIIARNAVSVSVRIFRRYQTSDGWFNVAGPWSEQVAVTPLTVVNTKGGGKR